MKKIAFYTLGCKVNQADTASMESIFRAAGYEVVGFAESADVYLINTCVVTNTGQRKSRQIINRAVRRSPLSLVVVTGCYPQTAPEEVRAIEGVDVIIGNQERGRIVELVEQALERKETTVLDNVQQMTVDTKFEELGVGTETDKTRAFLKIQEGCNQYCTYCIIPFARGPLRSRSLPGIREEVAKLVAAGYKEVVLIGIHLGCYGKELLKEGRHVTLYDAVQAALSVEGVRRLRLGSLESVEVEPRLLELMAREPRLCRHLHLPLQSGCDKVLRAMHRPYDTARFAKLLQEIRQQVPDVAITTDVIVGFPGETEEDFLTTLDFARQCGFAKMHIFPYSKRKGTPAAAMPEQVDEAVKAQRAAELAELDAAMHQETLASMVGRTEEVLFEQPVDAEHMEGLCGPYLRVVVRGTPELAGEIRRVKLTGVQDDWLTGELA
ncbi:MAG: tRNA (N(6)-L-threonylcarbamoyladenosine(37)-C(2))-methylthiotransferase MtaB [Phascolarctobacterium sp.]|uniref:tRNA (N(6)-L-threonylcarbamoyladenosine(37)-C(2))- methylthiotransferase MtaB n=1 Tax=Phascolarctobacterium sp. TaxID=2049039 RepID=UPI0026DAE2CA|nr:tRNA (N(6)-L-threonylcarbamoyladenosine(37)-C(2))-methylthiotransferase MtaB [Phascolarctobacterium sp.]MDO4921477.1 tRNA (N(6)-L-threonylcarbamoyladenosine(37)-C(2))-methylthiotransferase MtaB [Phascolarctobacterium sp.]